MSPAEALREQIYAFVHGRVALRDLRTWLGLHVRAIEDAADPEARDLAGEAWALFSELDYGHRDEDDVKRALLGALPSPSSTPPRVWDWTRSQSGLVSTGADNETSTLSEIPVTFTQPGSPVRWLVGRQPAGVSS
jgi:hypothetical protein